LADIEAGSVPGIQKLFSLAAGLKISLDELLLVFGVDANEVPQFAGPLEPGLAWPQSIEGPHSGFRFPPNFDTNFIGQETSLLKVNPQELAAENDLIQDDIAMPWSA
jgi:hypothetical protein